MLIQQLFDVILERREDPKEDSYTNRLLTMGEDEILKKIGEESVEIILAAKGQGDERLVSEIADLTYHLLVLLAQRGLSPEDVEIELEKRLPAANS
jgi:phosphoribosyl-ATP pyrophosphohydrolase